MHVGPPHADIRSLDHPRGLARTLARSLACDLDRARLRACAFDRARDLDRVRAFDLVRALDLAAELARALAHDLALAHIRARALDQAHVHACDLARALVIARECEPGHDLGGGADTLSQIRQALESLGKPREEKAQPERTTPSARWMTGLAVRLLPPVDRSRYAEEWRGELWEISSGARRRQIAHAFRLLLGARGTRRGTLAGRRRPAGG